MIIFIASCNAVLRGCKEAATLTRAARVEVIE